MREMNKRVKRHLYGNWNGEKVDGTLFKLRIYCSRWCLSVAAVIDTREIQQQNGKEISNLCYQDCRSDYRLSGPLREFRWIVPAPRVGKTMVWFLLKPSNLRLHALTHLRLNSKKCSSTIVKGLNVEWTSFSGRNLEVVNCYYQSKEHSTWLHVNSG